MSKLHRGHTGLPRSKATHRKRSYRKRQRAFRRFQFEMLEDRRLLAIDFTGAANWVEQGPGPIENGQVVGLGAQNNPVSGAIETVLAHPTDSDILLAGSVNGGVWRTDNATAANPTWTPLTDNFESLSISDLAFSPLDATNNTIFAATGDFRSGSTVVGGGTGDGAIGLLVSTDGGATWSNEARDDFLNLRIRSVEPTSVLDAGTGQQIVLAATIDDAGLFISTDGGESFTLVSGSSGATDGVDNDNDGTIDEVGELNFPLGSVSMLAPDPGNPSRYYAAIPNVDPQTFTNNASPGFYRTDDAGITWQQVNGTAGNTITTLAGTSRLQMSVSAAGTNPVYAATITGGVVTGLFRSPDQGANWTQLDTPSTNEGGMTFGLNPGGGKPGGQGRIHFSILADPNNANIVYVGGDRQPRPGPDGIEGNADDAFPNSIGATDFTGRLFQLNAALALGTQSTPITDNFAGGTGPHADSRDMVVDADGNIVESDDGGVYRFLLSRRSDGIDNDFDFIIDEPDEAVWVGVNGSLRVTEFYGVDYDPVNNLVIGGTQDVGSPTQNAFNNFTYDDIIRGDGFISEAGVLDVSSDGLDNDLDAVIDEAGESLVFHYQTSQNLGTFRRRILTDTNIELSNTNIANVGLLVNGVGGATTSLANIDGLGFLQQYGINNIDPRRMIIGTNFVHESFDAGINLIALGGITGLDTIDNDTDAMVDEPDEITLQNPVGGVNAIAYGGRMGGVDMPDVLYLGTNGGTVNGTFGRLILRTAITSGTLTDFAVLTSYPGVAPIDIAMDPNDFQTVFVLDANGNVYRSTDAGATVGNWTDLTGNLPDQTFVTELTTIEFVPGSFGENDVLAVGGLRGVMSTELNTPTEDMWLKVGANLPNVRAFELVYDETDDRLLAGTIGRGAWVVNNASFTLQQEGVLTICGDEDHINQDDVIRLVRNDANPTLLDVFLNNTTNVPDTQIPLGIISQINVFGVGGNDLLEIDSTNGLIVTPQGVRYDGDGACIFPYEGGDPFYGFDRGFDTLSLTQVGGATHTSETLAVGQLPGSGISSIVGLDNGTVVTQVVYFEELEPVTTDVPANVFDVGATPGLASLLQDANQITYSDGLLIPDSGRFEIDNFEPIEFSNKVTVTIDAGAGNDTITANGFALPSGLTQIDFTAGVGDDIVMLESLPAAVTSTVFAGEGDDLVDARQILFTPLTLDGAGGNDVLIGGHANDTINGGLGDDRLVGGVPSALLPSIGSNTYDGGLDFDTIAVIGTSADDVMAVNQTGAGVFSADVNGFIASETELNVEQVQLEPGQGDDILAVNVADALVATPAGSLSFRVIGDAPNASDLLVVRDDGLGDLVIHREGTDGRSGSVNVGPLMPVVYEGIESVDIIPLNSTTGATGTDGMGRLIVFSPDPFEQNDSREVATFLGSQPTFLQDLTIDPGGVVLPPPFGNIPGDEDWFEFRPDKIGTFRFEVLFEEIGVLANGRLGLPQDGDIDIGVFDDNGLPIVSSSSLSDDEVVDVSMAADTSYFLRVDGFMAGINVYDLLVSEVDVVGPQIVDPDGVGGVNAVHITDDLGTAVDESAFDIFDIKPAAGPTPDVTSITLNFQDILDRLLLNRAPGDVYPALDPISAAQAGNYSVVGDSVGAIAIANVIVTNAPALAGTVATATVELQFAEPLPDDRFTLTVFDTLLDPAGNLADGETNAGEPQEAPTFPTGDGVAGGDFVARFTVDSRPELGVYAGTTVTADINGNLVWDPNNLDATNRDLTFEFGSTSDQRFAGKFQSAANPGGIGGFYDALAAYGFFNGSFRFLIDTNLNGAFDAGVDLNLVSNLQINGLAVAGDFDAVPANGDELGIFDGESWFLDTNNDMLLDTTLTGLSLGFPIVGDFDGDGLDDLATYQADVFHFDLAADGLGVQNDADGLEDATISTLSAIGVGERPVAADMDHDGIDDVGLWIPNTLTQGSETGEWRFLLSDFQVNAAGAVTALDHAFSPQPVGHDMAAYFGNSFALPVVGNFDPPLGVNSGNQIDTGPLHGGIAAQDNVAGDGFLMYSEESVFTRFAANPPAGGNSDHLVAVSFDNGQWFYDNNSGLFPFNPIGSDLIVAAIDFSNDTIASLQGVVAEVEGIEAGYADGDVTYHADQFGGSPNNGEFEVTGTFIQRHVNQTPGEFNSVGELNAGIAATDNLRGAGFLMYSEESIFTRFGGNSPYSGNSEHLIAVAYLNGQWHYDSNSGLFPFAPDANDVLLASIDFANDTVTSLEGLVGQLDGVQVGYAAGDITFHANQFGGAFNSGEFEVEGTFFVRQPDELSGEVTPVGSLNDGIAADDRATGSGFLMYSKQDVFTRFAGDPPYATNSDHLIAVMYADGQWHYDNNGGMHPFTPDVSDLLLATIDFSNKTIVSLEGVSGQTHGIAAGYANGDLAFHANQFGGAFNGGEYQVEGTLVLRHPGSSGELSLAGPLNDGVAVDDNAFGTGFLLYSEESVFTRLAAHSPYAGNSEHFIAVQNQGGFWYYNDNQTWRAFTPRATDLLVAEVDFTFDEVISLQGNLGSEFGIDKGYSAGDLSFFADQLGGSFNEGEFDIEGTYFVR